MKKHWKVYVFWIALAEMTGALSGWLSRRGTALYEAAVLKPPLSPPGLLFPVVWTALYALMGTGAARVYLTPASNARSRALMRWLLQLAVNFFWSLIFFNLQAFGFALIWLLVLWALIFWMTAAFYGVDRPAARLQIPYLVWVGFAAYLNAGVWWLNR